MVCAYQINNKEDTVMYFSLEGACEVEMMYPVFKVSDGSKWKLFEVINLKGILMVFFDSDGLCFVDSIDG